MNTEEKLKAIQEFKEIYEDELGQSITHDEASVLATNILNLFDCLKQKEYIE